MSIPVPPRRSSTECRALGLARHGGPTGGMVQAKLGPRRVGAVVDGEMGRSRECLRGFGQLPLKLMRDAIARALCVPAPQAGRPSTLMPFQNTWTA